MSIFFKPGSSRNMGNLRRPTKDQIQRIMFNKSINSLIHNYNYESLPGSHTQVSPVVGSRAHELFSVRNNLIRESAAYSFECGIYCNTSLLYIIPAGLKELADTYAQQIFEGKLKKYADYSVTPSNAVRWVNANDNAPVNSVRINLGTGHDTPWHIEAFVRNLPDINNGKYLPKDVIAYHELDHVEETPVFAHPSLRPYGLRELLTRMRSLLILDEIYRKLHSIEINEKVNYKKPVTWDYNNEELGDLIAFFRDLERTYGSLAKAFTSNEALSYMKTGGKILILIH